MGFDWMKKTEEGKLTDESEFDWMKLQVDFNIFNLIDQTTLIRRKRTLLLGVEDSTMVMKLTGRKTRGKSSLGFCRSVLHYKHEPLLDTERTMNQSKIRGSSLSNLRSSPKNCQIKMSLKFYFWLKLVFVLSYGHNGQD